jgi:hypothetical protein
MSALEDAASLAILDQAAAAIRDTGEYRAGLDGDEVRALVLSVIEALLAEHKHVRAEVVRLEVHMEEAGGVADGAVQILSPVTATLSPTIALENGSDPTRIQLQELKMKTEAGIVARTMIAALNLEKQIRSALADPNTALAEVLAPELRTRGAELTGLELHFERCALVAQLSGHGT